MLNKIYKYTVLLSVDLLSSTNITKYLNFIKDMEFLSADEILTWQSNQLKNIVAHFYANSVYYKKRMDNIGLSVSDIKSIEDIEKLPILTKDDLRDNYSNVIPQNTALIKHKTDATGGSTGNPLKYLLDIRSLSFNTAFNINQWEKHGYKYGQKYLALGSSSLRIDKKKNIKYILYNKLRGRIPLSAINLSEDIIRSYIAYINKHKIKYIYGYASAIYILANYIIAKNIAVESIDICFTTSETLLWNYRQTIRQAFNCNVVDCYGARDGGVSAYEIEPKNYLVSYNSYLEIENRKSMGALLTTDLLNYAFPFIRYKLGDEVELSKENKTLYNGQILKKIIGRTPDIIKLENGNVLTGPGFTILFKDINVNAYQIQKHGRMNILCRIVTNEKYKKSEEQLIVDTIKRHAGHDCKVEIEYLDNIQLTMGGKNKFFMT